MDCWNVIIRKVGVTGEDHGVVRRTVHFRPNDVADEVNGIVANPMDLWNLE